ncbi:hypothetical protein MOQ_005714 [Trypanosoma cruzi marinkellei]|uniref:Uncharacterized protein n=1 Tax=Trypanosoma cruzi marinkellei TaxID=85056 RepID=K2M696_TRYCR|nr:hypothetical protein MOQ_005714 [Trypanosoma cruzi marinkellei]
MSLKNNNNTKKQHEGRMERENIRCVLGGPEFSEVGLAPQPPIAVSKVSTPRSFAFLQFVVDGKPYSMPPMYSPRNYNSEVVSMIHAEAEASREYRTVGASVLVTAGYSGVQAETISYSSQTHESGEFLPLPKESMGKNCFKCTPRHWRANLHPLEEATGDVDENLTLECAAHKTLFLSPRSSVAAFPQGEGACDNLMASCTSPRCGKIHGEGDDKEDTAEMKEKMEKGVFMTTSLLPGTSSDFFCRGKQLSDKGVECGERILQSCEEVIDTTTQKPSSQPQKETMDSGCGPLEKTWVTSNNEMDTGHSSCLVDHSVDSSMNMRFHFSVSSMGAMRLATYSMGASQGVVVGGGGNGGGHHVCSFHTQSKSCVHSEEKPCCCLPGKSVSLNGLYMRTAHANNNNNNNNKMEGSIYEEETAAAVTAAAAANTSPSLTQDASMDALFQVLDVPPELRLQPEGLMDVARFSLPLPVTPPVATGPLSFTVRSDIFPAIPTRDNTRNEDDPLNMTSNNEEGTSISGSGANFRPLWFSPPHRLMERMGNGTTGVNSISGDDPSSALCLHSPSVLFTEQRCGHGGKGVSHWSPRLPEWCARHSHNEPERHEVSDSFKSPIKTDLMARSNGTVEILLRSSRHAAGGSGTFASNTSFRRQATYPHSGDGSTFQLPTFRSFSYEY